MQVCNDPDSCENYVPCERGCNKHQPPAPVDVVAELRERRDCWEKYTPLWGVYNNITDLVEPVIAAKDARIAELKRFYLNCCDGQAELRNIITDLKAQLAAKDAEIAKLTEDLYEMGDGVSEANHYRKLNADLKAQLAEAQRDIGGWKSRADLYEKDLKQASDVISDLHAAPPGYIAASDVKECLDAHLSTRPCESILTWLDRLIAAAGDPEPCDNAPCVPVAKLDFINDVPDWGSHISCFDSPLGAWRKAARLIKDLVNAALQPYKEATDAS